VIANDMAILGQNIARLRITKQLKQSELAYEAGVSERTLQRIEAGDVVKTDGLLKVIRQLGRIDEFLSAVGTASFSPNQLARQAALSKHRTRSGEQILPANVTSFSASQKMRVRDSGKGKEKVLRSTPQKIVWPEDQE